jgi:glycosyltransferase involved in cell wall biosynthesis
MKLGIIARCDNTGLGNQTRELVKMLNPHKILLINSQFFNNNKQYPDWYKDYNVYSTKKGMPTTKEIIFFLKDVDVVISCETFYHLDLVDLARKQGTKTILQYNYELFGNLTNPDWSLPDVLLSPSLWNIDIVKEKFGSKCEVIHLPPPTDESLFNKAKENNLSKNHNRILHIGGKKAAKDRNGTESIFEMIKYSKEDYELVIKSQTPLDIVCKDPRVKIEIGNPANREDMYDGFDAMILPRRYAGLCLPMNEALLSALPVFMTDISPNNTILPKDWLVESSKTGSFRTKLMVDIYSIAPDKFANIVDEYIRNNNKQEIKEKALSIGIENFSVDNLKQKYLDIINK